MMTKLPPFTPVVDCVAQELGMVPALVYGLIWRYCQLDGRVCRASKATLAKHAGIARHTVLRHVEALVRAGYLVDLTPDLKGKPHSYQDTGKAFAGVTESNNTCSPEQHGVLLKATTPVAQSNTKRQETLKENIDTTPVGKAPTEQVQKRAPPRVEYSEGQRQFLEVFGAKRFRLVIQRDTVRELEEQHGTTELVNLARWAGKRGMTLGGAVIAVESALKKRAGQKRNRVLKVA